MTIVSAVNEPYEMPTPCAGCGDICELNDLWSCRDGEVRCDQCMDDYKERASDACRIVAAHQIAAIVDEHLSWEDCPEIGEHDWMTVQEAAKEIAREHRVSPEEYRAAYALLESRANQEGDS